MAPFSDTGIPHEGAAAIAGRDLDGDGLDDIALKTSAQIRARFRTGPAPDLLASATDGFGVAAIFAFRPLTDVIVHAAGTSAGWPDPHLQTNDLVVSQLSATDGTGKGYRSTTEFRYEGLRGNLQGRGSLGFGRVIRAESRGEGLSTVLTRRQDFPFIGLPQTLVVQQPNGRAVASTGYAWSKLDIGPTLQRRLYPYPSSVTTRRFEVGGNLDGAEIARTVHTIAAIDATSGVVTDETRTTTEVAGGANAGSSSSLRILNSDLLNDTANWCLGRPQALEITASHTLPGGAPIVRTADQAWDGANCRPTRIRLFPGDSQWQVTHDLGYDGFGNVASERVTGAGMAARTVTTQWGARGQLPVQVDEPAVAVNALRLGRSARPASRVHGSERPGRGMDIRRVWPAGARDAAGRNRCALVTRGVQGPVRRAREVSPAPGRSRQRGRRETHVMARHRPARSRIPPAVDAARRRLRRIDDGIRHERPHRAARPAALGRRTAAWQPVVRVRPARPPGFRSAGGSRRPGHPVGRMEPRWPRGDADGHTRPSDDRDAKRLGSAERSARRTRRAHALRVRRLRRTAASARRGGQHGHIHHL